MKKFEVKDFITIGLFAAIYIVMFMIIMTILGGLSPVIYLYTASLIAFILGPVYMLFLSKIQKKLSVLIMGAILILIIWAMTGGLWTVLVIGLTLSVLAELSASKGNYKSFKFNALSYMFFAMWPMSVYSNFWIFKEKMISQTASYGYGDQYVETLKSLISTPVYISMVVAIIIMALLGALLGKKMLKKHFIRAGIV